MSIWQRWTKAKQCFFFLVVSLYAASCGCMLSVGTARSCQRSFTLRFLSSMIWMSGKVSPDTWLSLPIHIFKHCLFHFFFLFATLKLFRKCYNNWDRGLKTKGHSPGSDVSAHSRPEILAGSLPVSPSCCWIRFQFFFFFFSFDRSPFPFLSASRKPSGGGWWEDGRRPGRGQKRIGPQSKSRGRWGAPSGDGSRATPRAVTQIHRDTWNGRRGSE